MPQKWYTFTITARPVWSARLPKVHTAKTATVVARNNFEAIMFYKDKSPKMFVLSCERGATTAPPPQRRV